MNEASDERERGEPLSFAGARDPCIDNFRDENDKVIALIGHGVLPEGGGHFQPKGQGLPAKGVGGELVRGSVKVQPAEFQRRIVRDFESTHNPRPDAFVAACDFADEIRVDRPNRRIRRTRALRAQIVHHGTKIGNLV